MVQIYRLACFSMLLLLLASPVCVRSDGEDSADDDEYGSDERALLVVRKSVSSELAVQGRNVTVSIDIYNAGTRCVCSGSCPMRRSSTASYSLPVVECICSSLHRALPVSNTIRHIDCQWALQPTSL